MKKILLISLLAITTTGCTEFALLMSGSSLAVSQSTYARMYNVIDVGVVVTTKKGIKYHVYEKGKKYIYEKGKKHVQTLTQITNN